MSVLGAILGALLVLAEPVSRDVPYDFDRTWTSTMRFLRVDRRWPIREQDREIGVVVFEFSAEKKKRDAYLELIKIADAEGRDAVRLRLRVDDVSIFARESFLDRLTAKVREDYGPPPKKKPDKPPEEPRPPPPDAGPTLLKP